MKPTEHTAKPAVTPKTGRFATLRVVLHEGSGASARSLVAAPLLALCALFALLAFSASAQAEPPKLILYGKFQTGEYPLGIALDQAGNVYVAGLESSKINEYDASGKLISPPSPFGGGSEYYSGAVVNPSDGDLYVVDSHEQEIDTYDPSSGALLSSFSVSGCANALFGSVTSVQIASDSAGDVYLPCAPENAIREYSSTGTLLHTLTGSGTGALNKPTGVAVDSSGDIWVADAGNNRVEELSSSDTVIHDIKSEGVRAVALDSGGDILAIVDNSLDACGSYEPPCEHLVEYDAEGKQLDDIGAGSLAPSPYETFHLFNSLAVNQSNGRVYLTDFSQNLVWIYGPPSAPTVGSELAAEIATSEAKLGALVSPGGIPTAYRFEYGATTAYGHTTPFPEGSVGEGLASRTAWASASGLAPATTYHYRVIATNELGTVVGPDQTFTTLSAAEAACPNEQLRGGYSASLPDCRAYELVTPVTAISSQPSEIHQREIEPQGLAARGGESFAFTATDVLPGSDSGGKYYVAARGEGGWSSEDVTPRQSYTGDRCTTGNTRVDAYSPDLSADVLFVGGGEVAYQYGEYSRGGGCGAEPVEVVSGEPLGVENLLLRDNANATYQLINPPPLGGIAPENAHFDGASADLSHVVFNELAPLTANAPDGADNLYEWTAGAVRLLTVLPDGTATAGPLAAAWTEHPHVVSADGSRVFFTAGGKLYVRLNGTSTVQLDASQAGGAGGGGRFQEASASGSLVFFSDDASAGLTSDTTPGSGANLYLYDLETGGMTDLTPGGGGSSVTVDGASEDGSYLYFTAETVLAPGAVAGQSNIYLWHGGAVVLVASFPRTDVACEKSCRQPISSDGNYFAFTTSQSLPTVNFPAGYDNTDATTGRPDDEAYLYDAASNQLACASCDPSGAPPVAGGAVLEVVEGAKRGDDLSDAGRLFFETKESLLPRDSNGEPDVYEYEDGQVNLISSGTGSSESRLIDASETGDDVFFMTRQQLVPQDTHAELRVIYDARVDGGFPAQVSPPQCVTADACRAPVSPQPASFGAPASATFSGAGNISPPTELKPKTKPKSTPLKCKRGFVKKKGKCVRQPKQRKKTRKSAHANTKTGK